MQQGCLNRYVGVVFFGLFVTHFPITLASKMDKKNAQSTHSFAVRKTSTLSKNSFISLPLQISMNISF